jgi:hypothetical protein
MKLIGKLLVAIAPVLIEEGAKRVVKAVLEKLG